MCEHDQFTTWVDADGRVTHDAPYWPPMRGYYCYRCQSYLDKRRRVVDLERLRDDPTQ